DGRCAAFCSAADGATYPRSAPPISRRPSRTRAGPPTRRRPTRAPHSVLGYTRMTIRRPEYRDTVARIGREVARGEGRMVARVNTPWTFLGLEAWLDRHWNAGAGRGYVIVMPNSVGERAGPRTDVLAFLRRYPDVEAIHVAPFTTRSHRLQNALRVARLA